MHRAGFFQSALKNRDTIADTHTCLAGWLVILSRIKTNDSLLEQEWSI